MTDYTKLIEALRYCKINEPCERCPLAADDDGNGKCVNELHDDAVDAIEELAVENERLNGIIDVFVKEDAE